MIEDFWDLFAIIVSSDIETNLIHVFSNSDEALGKFVMSLCSLSELSLVRALCTLCITPFAQVVLFMYSCAYCNTWDINGLLRYSCGGSTPLITLI